MTAVPFVVAYFTLTSDALVAEIDALGGLMARAIDATGVRIDWDEQEIGLPAIAKHGDPFPKEALDSIRRNKVGLKGPLTTELGTGMRSVNVALRKEFDLYANLRPARTYEGVQAPMGKIDLVVVRENIEDLYAGIEYDLGTKELAEVRAAILLVLRGPTRSAGSPSGVLMSQMRRATRLSSSPHGNI